MTTAVVDFDRVRDRAVRKAITAAYREYMGPSGNGMTDKELHQLAGWESFLAGWDACDEYAGHP